MRMISVTKLSTACLIQVFFFFKQKTAYEMRISDWSSDVCSSDLGGGGQPGPGGHRGGRDLRLGGRGDPAHPVAASHHPARGGEIGRASCRERVCQYV